MLYSATFIIFMPYKPLHNNKNTMNMENENSKENSMSNIPPFQIGDKVVYITGNNMAKDSVHVVRGLAQSPCGCWLIYIDVQVWQPPSLGVEVVCVGCGKKYILNHKRGWCASSFRPVQEQKFPLISYSKVLEEVVVGAN